MRTAALIGRIGWTMIVIIAVEAIVCGLAAIPVVAFWIWLTAFLLPAKAGVRVAAFALALVPSYVVFAIGLMGWSPVATWATRARTPAGMELRIADLDWPLMTWIRYMAATHVVRIFAGSFFRGTPLWTAYLRLDGARLGRGVYVNTTSISDHNLLEFGDGVVVGADVHVSGHTVEDGLVKTGRVRLGRQVTIGLGTMIEIDVDAGDGCRVGALSFVPKHARLEAGATYAGIPVEPIGPARASPSA